MGEIKRVQQTLYVNKYVAFDGREFDTMSQCDDYEKRKRGERVTCDKCNGKGYISNGWHKVLNELTYQFEDVEYTQNCSKCNGKGYLDKVEIWK
jgi:DnaJ-class molecular chaperone